MIFYQLTITMFDKIQNFYNYENSHVKKCDTLKYK